MNRVFRALFLILFILCFASCRKKEGNIQKEGENNCDRFYAQAASLLEESLFDSVLGLLSNNRLETLKPSDSLSIAHFQLRGWAHLRKRNMEEAIASFHISDSLARQYGRTRQEIKAKEYLLTAYTDIMKFETALQYGLESLELAKVNDKKSLGGIYEELARVHFYLQPKSTKAIEYLRLARDEAWEFSDSSRLARTSFKVSTIFFARQELDSAERYLDDAVKYQQNREYIFAQQELDSVEVYLKEAIDNQQKSKENIDFSFACTIIGNIWRQRGNYTEAIKYYKLAQNINDSLGLPQANNYYNRAIAYHYWNKPQMAMSYFNKTIEAVKVEMGDGKSYSVLKNAYNELAELNEEKGVYSEALVLYKSYIKCMEREYEENLERNLADLETKYVIKEKERKIEHLQQEMEFEIKSKHQQYVIIIALIFLLLAVILFWILYHKQKISNQKQEQSVLEQQLLRSQINPHFILNTFTTIQRLISENKIKQANKHLIRFSKVLRLSLDNSIIPFVPVQEEVEALKHYMELQLVRFDREFLYTISVYEGFEDDNIYIPPMLIQPFVENTIEYGFHGIETAGQIQITLNRKKNHLFCEIEDNGKDVYSGKGGVNMPTKKNSLSVEITQKRLKLLGRKLKTHSNLEIKNRNEYGNITGLSVRITIPFQKKSSA